MELGQNEINWNINLDICTLYIHTCNFRLQFFHFAQIPKFNQNCSTPNNRFDSLIDSKLSQTKMFNIWSIKTTTKRSLSKQTRSCFTFRPVEWEPFYLQTCLKRATKLLALGAFPVYIVAVHRFGIYMAYRSFIHYQPFRVIHFWSM